MKFDLRYKSGLKYTSAVAALCLLAGSAAAQTAAPSPAPGVPGTVAVPGTGFEITSSSYVLVPSDTVDISVQGHDDLHQTVQILPDGTFNYPIVGPIQAAGKTRAQLQDEITRGLSDQYNQPIVTVILRDSHTRGITVSGIVRSPGTYAYRTGISLLEVLAAAGGSNQTNETTQVTLISGKSSRSIDLVSLLDGDPAQNVTLLPGDTLLFSQRDPAKVQVQIVGQVGRPGQYGVMREGATLISILTEAGGATASAALSHVQVVRYGRTFTFNLHPTLYNIDDPSGRIRIYAGDTINVPLNNTHYTVYGEVRGPGVYTIPDGEPLPLTTAIGVAGGTTNDTDKRAVGIVRKHKDGTPYLTTINLDESLKGQSRVASLAILPDDVIVVPKRRPGFAPLSALGTALGLAYSSEQLKYLVR